MTSIYAQIALQLTAAWVAGGVIGSERSYHGRAAGFRTHALVAIAAASVVLVSRAPSFAPGAFAGGDLQLDPTRLAQGVMTGIGFLGAGVIFKEGVNIQGLTTAASVWATAGVGILFGVGAYVPGALLTAAVLTTLIVLRWAEMAMPAKVYVWSVFRFKAEGAPTGDAFKAMLAAQGASIVELSYARQDGGATLEYSGVMRTPRSSVLHTLSDYLRGLDGLVEYQLQRISK
jgi:putative Mg2+ transporter-C (MgtC) family protein